MMPLWIFPLFVYKICTVLAVNQASNIIQDSGVKTVAVGEKVTLHCSCRDDAMTFLSWYHQSLGGKPQIIFSRMKHSLEANIFPAFRTRFQVVAQTQKGINDLVISDLQLSDSGTYYCGSFVVSYIEFGHGVFLNVKESLSSSQSAVHQPAVERLPLGESVNLSCLVFAHPCAGDQSLYWFRPGGSQPAVMYPSDRQCTSLSDEKHQWTNCTFNIVIESASSSDAGTYYCALASCGEVVFGKGTRVEIVGSTTISPLLVYFLGVALAISIIVLLLLAFIFYKLKSKLGICEGRVSDLTLSAASDTASRDEDSLHYAALSLKRSSKRPHQEDNMDSVCVYSRVKSRK
ncbi:signal-regulatory protein beta-2-like isoform X2 [Melanotaenia boesemani]|uniref:signal-regulatory protein beta-2-like isoform X2 n=1 Tax=Melanotaenia boesemani TaxID=1250792 RepID=UPI001C051423|nr:signal-regulatory protein beta-2-like isoform X2 [Melanotaenia boesemani]